MAKETPNHLNAARRYLSINPLLTMNLGATPFRLVSNVEVSRKKVTTPLKEQCVYGISDSNL